MKFHNIEYCENCKKNKYREHTRISNNNNFLSSLSLPCDRKMFVRENVTALLKKSEKLKKKERPNGGFFCRHQGCTLSRRCSHCFDAGQIVNLAVRSAICASRPFDREKNHNYVASKLEPTTGYFKGNARFLEEFSKHDSGEKLII